MKTVDDIIGMVQDCYVTLDAIRAELEKWQAEINTLRAALEDAASYTKFPEPIEVHGVTEDYKTTELVRKPAQFWINRAEKKEADNG